MKKSHIFKWTLSAILFMVGTITSNAMTASEAFDKGKSKIESAKSVSADFILTVNGNSAKGSILTKGSKFVISSDAGSSWYNGKDLYSYNPVSNETTVFSPDESELAEVNPLLYLSSSDDYKVMGTKNKKDGFETAILVPKDKNSTIKKVTIDLDSSTFLPKLISVETKSGALIDLKISNISLDVSVSDSSFTYPSKTYSSAKIIDLR